MKVGDQVGHLLVGERGKGDPFLLEVMNHLREVVPDIPGHIRDLARREVARHRVERGCVFAALAIERMAVRAALRYEQLRPVCGIADSRYRQIRPTRMAAWSRRPRCRSAGR